MTETSGIHTFRIGADPDAAPIDRRCFAEGEQRLEGAAWTSYHYCRDHLGSVREVVKSDGTLAARYDFDPYGKRRIEYESPSYASGGPCDMGFTGHLTITSPVAGQTELALAHFRTYDPALAVWLSPDPLGETGGKKCAGAGSARWDSSGPNANYQAESIWGARCF